MMRQEQLSIVTDKYLTCFNNILDQMIQQMNSAQLSNSISYNFIVQMIPHHKAAIEMSCNLLQYTTLVPLHLYSGFCSIKDGYARNCGRLVPLLKSKPHG